MKKLIIVGLIIANATSCFAINSLCWVSTYESSLENRLIPLSEPTSRENGRGCFDPTTLTFVNNPSKEMSVKIYYKLSPDIRINNQKLGIDATYVVNHVLRSDGKSYLLSWALLDEKYNTVVDVNDKEIKRLHGQYPLEIPLTFDDREDFLELEEYARGIKKGPSVSANDGTK